MGQRYAVLIGINEFKDPDLSKLSTPPQNVSDLASLLNDPEIGYFNDVKTLPHKSLKGDVEREIAKLFKNKQSDDVLLLYFSGHGILDEQGTLFFALHETEKDLPEVTALSSNLVRGLIENSNSQQIVVILDCCFGGAFGRGRMSGSNETVNLRESLGGRGYGRVVLTASNATSYAWEGDKFVGDIEHSVFTAYLIEGLKTGHADRNLNGEITVNELYDYIRLKMEQSVARQRPNRITFRDEKEIIIAKNPNLYRIPPDLQNAATHYDSYMREVAVRRLTQLIKLQRNNPPLVQEAINLLRTLSADPSPDVADFARRSLEEIDEVEEVTGTYASGERQHFSIYLSAPDDVEAEREKVRRVIRRLNRRASFDPPAYLEVVTGDNGPANASLSVPAATESPAKHVKRPGQSDIVLVILWSQMGEPPPESITRRDGSPYASITEWDYEDAMAGFHKRSDKRPKVLLYRRNEAIRLSRGDRDFRQKILQWEQVENFFARFDEPGASPGLDIHDYDAIDDFEQKIENDLTTLVQEMLARPEIAATAPSPLPENKQPDQFDENKLRELRDTYLKWLIQLHSWLELRGVREAKSYPRIPLDNVYVALKGDRSTAYERLSSQEQLDIQLMEAVEMMADEFTAQEIGQQLEEIRRQILVENPVMISLAERDRSTLNIGTYAEKVTLAEAFQRERSLVILGDPGSGKTTLERWLTIKLAQAMLDKTLTVSVEANKVDPEAGESNKPVNLGPTRLPVLVRVSDYAEAFLKARKEGRVLPLVDFLGYHSWPGEPTPFTEAQKEGLNFLIKRHLDRREAVILLDGMDEISSSSDRQDIVDAIATFIDEKIRPVRTGIVTSRIKNLLTLEYQIERPPVEVGGNQIVITSRIAGYHAAPIKRDLAHVTIEPMSRVAVEYFCDMWSLAINQLIQPGIDPETLKQTAQQESARLKADIFDPARPRIRELASNPLLVTILALVHRKQGSLPERRADLYQRALEILVEDWRKTGLLIEELIYVLSPLAAHIHQKYATGLIQKNELKQIITRELAVLRNVDPDDPPPGFQRDVREFLRVVHEDVGILAARGEELYGFLHLTFQEYLAALYLIRKKRKAATEIIARLDDPRWREPILLALGHIGSWLPDQSEKVLLAMLTADEPLGALIPRTPMLIVTALDEMANVSPLIIQEVVRRLLVTYADRNGLMRFDHFRAQIERQFARLRSAQNNPVIDQVLCDLIANPAQNRDLAPAVVTLIRRQQWFTPAIAEALMKALPDDSAEWDWPINKALREIVTPQPLVEPKKYPQPSDSDWEYLRTTDLLQYRELKARVAVADAVYADLKATYDLHSTRSLPELHLDHLPLKRALLQATNSDLVERIKGDADWTRLIVALYGGYHDYKAPDVLLEYSSIAYFLQQPDAVREQQIQRNREYYVGRFDPNDPIYSMAVYLDTGMNGKLERARMLPEFAVEAIYRDSPLTPRLLAALKTGKEASSLVADFWKLWSGASKPEVQVDALIALVALGEDVIPALEEALATDDRHVLAQTVLGRLAQLADLLRDPITRSFNQKPGEKRPTHLLTRLADDLSEQDWVDSCVALANAAVTYTGQPFQPTLVMAKGIVTEYILSEYWVRAFLGGADDDSAYTCGLALEMMSEDNSLSLADRIRSLAIIHKTQNLQRGNYIGHWSVEPLPSIVDDPTDIPMDVIDTVEAAATGELQPDLQDAVLSAFLDGTWTIVRDNPNLLPEYLILNLMNRYSRMSIVEHLTASDPSLTWEECYSLPAILNRARELKDPYYSARALLRIAELLPVHRSTLISDALSRARRIASPHLRCRLLERLLPHLPSKEQAAVLSEAVQAAQATVDPNHKARALARLASQFNGDKRRSMLLQAIQSAAAIPDTWWRAETLRELQGEFLDDPLLLAELRTTARRSGEKKERYRALDQRGINMFALHDHLIKVNDGDHRLWTPIELGALVSDIQRYFSVASNMDGTWNAIMNDPASPEADQLYEQGIESGLILTRIAATVINHWIETDQLDAAKRFMPLLQDPVAEAGSIVQNWLTHYDDFVANHAALYLAENNRRLTSQTIHGLLALLAEQEDRSRLRVPLILYGGNGQINAHSPRFFKATELDQEVFIEWGRAKYRFHIHDKRGAALELSRFGLEILFDDPNLITQLSQKVDGGGPDADATSETLKMMTELTEQAWSALRHSFEQGGSDLRRSLMESILHLCITEYKREHDENPSQWLKELSGELIPDLRAIPGGATPFIEAGQEALQLLEGDVDGNALAQTADTILEKKYAVSAADVVKLPEDQIRSGLADLALTSYHWNGQIFQDSSERSSVIVKNSTEMLQLLCAWLAEVLKKKTVFYSEIDNKCSYLLGIVAVYAEYSPDAFARLARKLDLEPLLVKAIKSEVLIGRVAAIELLRYLGKISADSLNALQESLMDTHEVVQAAMETFTRLRRIEGEVIETLIKNLNSPSASIAYTSSQALSLIGRSDRTPPEQRKRILQALVEAIRDPRSRRGIYMLSGTQQNIRSLYAERLDQALLQALIEVSGL